MKIVLNILLMWLCMSTATSLWAQNKYGSNLTFSINKGLNFTDTSAYPQQFKSHCFGAYVNSAAISDKKGNLLMYYAQDTFNGGGGWLYKYFGYIVDSGGNKIAGADSIFAIDDHDAQCLFLPDPSDSTVYWFFAIENNIYIPDTINHLSYIKFKILPSGSISITARQRYAYRYNFNESLRAIRHGNGRDWWLVSQNSKTNQWIRFLLTPSGLSAPMFQTYGTLAYTLDYIGSMCVSVDGEHIFLPNQPFITSFTFDRCTGLLSNYQRFDGDSAATGLNSYYSSAFYDTTTGIVIASSLQNIITYSLNTIDTLITKYKIVKTLSEYNDTSTEPGETDVYTFMLYNPFNAKHLYVYITQLSAHCSYHDDSLRNTISLINYEDTTNVKVTDRFIVTDSAEIFCPIFIQPNYNLGRLSGSPCDTLPYGLGTQEVAPMENDIKLYPNPANTTVTIETTYNADVSVIDMLGREISDTKVSTGKTILDVHALSNGIYMVVIRGGNGGNPVNRKLVITR